MALLDRRACRMVAESGGPGWKQPCLRPRLEIPTICCSGGGWKTQFISTRQDGYTFAHSSQGCSRMTLYGYARVLVREPEDKNLALQVERRWSALAAPWAIFEPRKPAGPGTTAAAAGRRAAGGGRFTK